MVKDRQHNLHQGGRMLVPLLLIAALPIAAMTAFILYQQKAAATDNPPPVTNMTTFGDADWPIFRGHRGLTGIAAGNLPKKLTLAWKFKTGGEILSTSVISAETAFVSSMDGHLYALELHSGKERWRFEADDELEASPLFHDGVVYIGSNGGTFYAVDATTGKTKWTFEKADKITGSANIATVGGKPLIVFGSYDSHLYGLNPDGTLAVIVEADNYINGAVAVAGSTAFFGSCDANVYCVPLGAAAELKTIDAGSYVAANPAVSEGIVYAGSYDGKFLAAEVVTQKIRWQYDETEDAFFSSPAVNDEVVVVGCRDGKLYCFDKAGGDIRWTFEAADNFDSSPVICGDIIAVGNDDGRLYLIDIVKGTEVFTYTLGDAVAAAPAIAQNYLLIGCTNGTLYAFTAP